LVGRETELSELSQLLHAPGSRLLTIVGAGGMGKTRLAIELARTTLELFADGAYLVALAPLASADALASAIVRALDLSVQDADLTTGLLRALRDKQLLLILDNFEHLLDGVGLVLELLQSAPGLRIVATSRERLNVRSEQRYLVQGMAYQPDALDADLAELPAVRLFVQSAQRTQPQFSLSEADLPAVLQICRLTLGMPLGLELAAAWVELLPLSEIAAQLARSAAFLAADLRDLPERQRSMRAVFDWSWRLLRADEQRILRRLTVFRGEFAIAAAQRVAEASLASLLRLVEKSLLRINDGRYELHDLLRQFAAEELDAEERAAVRWRHASYYLVLAEEAAPALAGPEQAAVLARLSREHDNFRAALAWCLETESAVSGSLSATERGGQSTPSVGLKNLDEEVGRAEGREARTTNYEPRIELGLRLAGALWPFWEHYCHLTEGRRWLESFLENEGAATVAPEVRAMALIGAGCLAQDQDDDARAHALFEEGLRLERTLGRTGRVTRVLAHRGIMVRAQGQYAQATALLEESLALARAAHDQAGIAYVLRRLGGVMRERGDYTRAASIFQECLATYRALGDRSGEGSVLLGLGDIARDQGDAATAEAYGAESLAVGRELGQHWISGFALNNLAQAAIMRGDYAQALPWAEEALALFRAQDIHGGVVELLITQGQIACGQGDYERARAALVEGVAQGWSAGPHELVAAGMEELARVAVARGNTAHAVRLCAAASAWREAMDAPRQPYRRATYEATLAAARQALGADGFTAAWAEGAAWRPEQAVAAAGAEGHDTAPQQLSEAAGDQPHPDVDERPREPDHPSRSPSANPPAPTHNLPSPLTSFVGRADELARLAVLLAGGTRLVTLTGAGGAGKTRLALAIAWQLLPQFADGVWWVALAGVQPADDEALQRATLASAVATALGRTLVGRRDPLDELADALQDRAALLVLDNCEHLGEVAAVARALLEAAPKLRLVATSREPLGLGGEALLRLEGLPVPLPGAADPASYAGVQLFLERAAQHTPGWGQDITDGAVARLCRLLDGLPLAIELAAHWVGYFSPDEIAEAIQADLDFLAARTRDVPDRHRSLRVVFDYAWRSLNAAEQQALMRFSVFRGGFDRAAAQAVADVRATTLVALVDKSLLQQAGVGRYSLHELLRQFAAERLGASGDAAAMRAQHAAYYLALAEQAAPELTRPDQAAALERLDRALDNLRAALSWVREQGQTDLGLRLAGALERFWFTRGYLSEGREWLERFLASTQAVEAPPAVRAQAFSAAGLLANTQGDRIQATRWLELGLTSYREADDLAGAVRALTTLGGVAYDQGDLRGAIERWEQSLAQARAVGDLGEVARALGNLGEAHYHLDDLARAAALHTEALALARQLGRTNLEAFQLGDLGNVARRQGDLVLATALHRQALELKRALGARRQIAITLEDLASVAAAEGRGTRAACLLGAATTIREAIGTPQAAPERIATEQAVAGARAALGEGAWAAAFMAGQALSLDQAIAYALE
jgi:non-specific serine/threonine protein kinase